MDGEDIFNLLKAIPEEENGFYNPGHDVTKETFKGWLKRQVEIANNIDAGLILLTGSRSIVAPRAGKELK